MKAWKQLVAFVVSLLILPASCAVHFHYRTRPETVLYADDGRVRGLQDRTRDIILGGLFPVRSIIPESDGGKCADTVRDHGIQTAEAMLFAIDTINSDPELLPNISLGYDIRDTCQSEKIGLDESADMVLANDSESCSSISSSLDKFLPTVMAVIGPLQSHVSIQIAPFFRIFQTPQISYASSSSTLNNRNIYSNFFRTKLPTNSQVETIVDIIMHYEWDHVSVIFSRNQYGESLANHFRQLAKKASICIDFNQPIYNDFTQPEYNEVAKELMASYKQMLSFYLL